MALCIDVLVCVQDISSSMTNSTATSKPPVTLRIVVPASQCGSLIGKGGCKIKEIREVGGVTLMGPGDRKWWGNYDTSYETFVRDNHTFFKKKSMYYAELKVHIWNAPVIGPTL